jgi:UDP-N-acetylglucosamine 2-epimerase (non-hydrolysing)
MQTVLTIIGTRPEAIKMAPVIKSLEKQKERIRSVVCSTGQHRHLIDQVFQLFQISPDYDLKLMQTDQTLSHLTGQMFLALDSVVREVSPDWVLAQGDTTTVMVAALVCFYRRVSFGHVEAGLRTGQKWEPFPEETNRRIADLLADIYFVPTENSRKTLLLEGVKENRIHVTGNTVIDALLDIAQRKYDWNNGPLSTLPGRKRLVLVTAHRRESFGQPFRNICRAIRDLACDFNSAGVHFVYPVHLNPNVRLVAQETLSGLENVSLIEPLDYKSMVHLIKASYLILTDSGGIQEEAPSLGIPVLLMRESTERPEGVKAGVVRLVGTDYARIIQGTRTLLTDSAARAAMASRSNPYGDGNAAPRIVNALLHEG